MRAEIIYEDNDILVIYKPAGLATQTAKLGQADVISELKNYLMRSQKSPSKAPVYLGVIHRLDQPVEGLLVFAKHKKAAADLTAQLQRQGEGGSLHKHYYAVACGKPAKNQGRLVDYMYKSQENLAVIVEEMGQGKEAVLEYKIVQQQQNLVLADINILTGRFHQIRAQMAHAGMPLLGDVKYGSPEAKELAGALGVQTVALCAYSLDFRHPVSKKPMHFQEKSRGKAFAFFHEINTDESVK